MASLVVAIVMKVPGKGSSSSYRRIQNADPMTDSDHVTAQCSVALAQLSIPSKLQDRSVLSSLGQLSNTEQHTFT